MLVPAGAAHLAFASAGWTQLKGGIADALKAFHAANPAAPGMAPETLRRQLALRLPARAFPFVVQALAKAGEVAFAGAMVCLPGHAVQLAPADDETWRRIVPLLSDGARFRPPRVVEIAQQLGASEAEIRKLLKQLSRMNLVSEVAPDHFFLRDTVGEMVEIAGDIAAKSGNGEFGAAEFRDRLDNGRKVAIQVLEFFDRHGVTLRHGDLRRMNPQKLHLFARRASGAAAA